MHPGATSGSFALWVRMYRLLLRIYPPALRRRFEGEMVQFFRDGYRRSSLRSGSAGVLAWLISSLADLIFNGLAERLQHLRRSAAKKRAGTPNSPSPPIKKGTHCMANRFQDLRFAIRSLRRQPVFALVVIVTVALGVGANTAMFSVIKGVLLTPLPYPDSECLALVLENDRINGTTEEGVSGPDYFDWLEQQTVFESMGALRSYVPTLTGSGDEPERLQASMFSHTLFRTLQWPSALGRVFTPQEDQPGGPRAAVISFGLWQRRFGGRSDAVGKTMMLDGESYEIVGVMPAGFGFPDAGTEVWLPLQYGPNTNSRGHHDLLVVGRLKDGSSIEMAQTEMSEIMRRLEEAYPDHNVGRGAYVQSLNEAGLGGVRPALWILMAAVSLVLLIACVNFANLLLSRSSSRRQELGVRASLGAGRTRLLAQLLTESLLLSLIGGLLAIGLAQAGIDLLQSLSPSGLPRLNEVEIDWTVLAFGFGIALVTGAASGLLPAWQASRVNLSEALQQGGRGNALGRQSKLRQALVVAEVALAFVLAAGAGLLIQSMWKLNRVEAGFEPDRLVTLSVNLPASRYPNSVRDWPKVPEVQNFIRDALEGLQRLPFVESAAMAVNRPTDSGWTSDIYIEGGPTTPEEGVEAERLRVVSRDYFSTVGVAVLKGRTYDRSDRSDSPYRYVVNQAFADKYFPDEYPIGKRFAFWNQSGEIIGVVGNVKFMGLDQESRPAVYPLLDQMPFSRFAILLRSRSDDFQQAIQSATALVRQLDPDLAIYDIGTIDELLSGSLSQRRFNAILLGLFAGLALLLAVVGVYGVISYGVSQRTHEFGVRMSLGAGRKAVIWMVLSQGLRLAGLGMLLGGLGSLAAAQMLSALLFEVKPTSPVNLLAVALFLGAVAALACLAPARKASRVDPLIALRSH